MTGFAHAVLIRGRHVKVVRAPLPPRVSKPARLAAPPTAPTEPPTPLADDVRRILRGQTEFPRLLWSEVI